jgi:hypothetical protein
MCTVHCPVLETHITERIEMRKVKDAIDMYNQMKEQGKPFILLLKMENYQRKKLYCFLTQPVTPYNNVKLLTVEKSVWMTYQKCIQSNFNWDLPQWVTFPFNRSFFFTIMINFFYSC